MNQKGRHQLSVHPGLTCVVCMSYGERSSFVPSLCGDHRPRVRRQLSLLPLSCTLVPAFSLSYLLSCSRNTVFCWWSLGVTCCVLKDLLTKKERWELPSPQQLFFWVIHFPMVSGFALQTSSCAVPVLLSPVRVHVWFSSAFHKLGWRHSRLVLLSPIVS